MSDSDFQFHRERKKQCKEKVEDIHLWVGGMSNDKKSSWAFLYMDGKRNITSIFGENECVDNLV